MNKEPKGVREQTHPEGQLTFPETQDLSASCARTHKDPTTGSIFSMRKIFKRKRRE